MKRRGRMRAACPDSPLPTRDLTDLTRVASRVKEPGAYTYVMRQGTWNAGNDGMPHEQGISRACAARPHLFPFRPECVTTR